MSGKVRQFGVSSDALIMVSGKRLSEGVFGGLYV
jgi:hypothetical protein